MVQQLVPDVVHIFRYRAAMEPIDPKSYLWGNICALIGGPEPTIDAAMKRLKVGRGTVQRIRDAQTSVGLDVLRTISGEFGIEVWQLLQPPHAKDRPLDWYSLAQQIATAHYDDEMRDALLDFSDKVDAEMRRLQQVRNERAKSHTP